MKKILSLLSVLTISGTAVPTTIAASPYQKEETIKNSDINYSQTNNLKNLKRNKRSLDTLDYKINFSWEISDQAIYTFNKSTWKIIRRAFNEEVKKRDDFRANRFSHYIKTNVFENNNLTNVSWKFNGILGIGYSAEFYKMIDIIWAKFYVIDNFINNNNDYDWFCLVVSSIGDRFYISTVNVPGNIDSILDKIGKLIITAGCAAAGSVGGPTGAAATAISCYYIS